MLHRQNGGVMEQRIVIWEIEARELAEHLLGGTIVGERSFYFGIKGTDILTINPSLKCTAFTNSGSALELLFRASSAVSYIFRTRTNSQIFFTVIQSIAIDMINVAIGGSVGQIPMQEHPGVFWTAFDTAQIQRVYDVFLSVPALKNVPTKRINALKIVSVDKGDVAAWKH